jgi:hypothetical protein
MWFHKGVIFFASLASWLLITHNVNAATIQAATANRSGIPGSAYQSEKENVVGQECITGSIVTQGTQRSTFSFEQILSEQQAASLMGLSAGGRARFGVVEASASARFMKNSSSNKLSVSAVWMSDYLLPNKKLTAPTLTSLGSSVREHDTRWAETCGDQYIDEIVYGARLFFSLRVDFASEEQKKSFETEFSISGPLYSANAKLDEASKKFSRDTKVTITGVQFGGDVSKLTGVLDTSPDGQGNMIECTLGNFDRCAKVIAAAVHYAADTEKGFPSQLGESSKPGPAILEYRTAPYSAAGIYPVNYPYLDEANEQARMRLHDAFENYLKVSVIADRLLSLRLNEPLREKISTENDKANKNIASILTSSKVCYETPLKCVASVNSIKFAEIDESAFKLPPFPRPSYRLMTVKKGVWPRAESIETMRKCKFSNPDITKDVPIPVCLPEILSDNPVSKLETVSTVLFIEGAGLDKATFYFEGVDLGGVSLRPDGAAYPEKRKIDSASIVITSNRSNPNWVDFDITSFIRKLINGQYPEADGVFYIVLKDVFGRTSRVDVAYLKWTSSEVNTSQGKMRRLGYFEHRSRAWDPDSDGISLVSPNSARLDSSARF